jgi:ABC-type amino acid transport substrate-binding protein
MDRATTIEPGVLAVASAFPDPPFEVVQDGVETGLDAELMELLCTRLGLVRKPVRYEGRDFNGIFDGLGTRAYDAVISGTTVTPEREKVALFAEPYLESGQSLVVNVVRTPHVTSVDDLEGQVVGIQVGNTSDAVARDLKKRGAIADIRYYPYGGIGDALDDLAAGRIGAFMKLLPVMAWLTRDRPELGIVQGPITRESLGIAVAHDNVRLRDAINAAQADLRAAGELDRLTARWLR